MKNVVWVILGILVVVAIVFLAKKDGGMTNDGGDQELIESAKVYTDSSGKELQATVTVKSAKISFSGLGNLTLKGEQPTLSGVIYKNEDGSVVFADMGPNATLSQNGVVIFEGTLKQSATN